MAQLPNPIASKKNKHDVGYKAKHKCQSCIHFMPATLGSCVQHQCELVAGAISPDGVCDLWEMHERSGPHDKEFYEKERMKHGE